MGKVKKVATAAAGEISTKTVAKRKKSAVAGKKALTESMAKKKIAVAVKKVSTEIISKRKRSAVAKNVSTESNVPKTDKAVAADPTYVLDDFKSHVECPICTIVPREGVMLMCVNGHNVCAVCKDKLGQDAKCPLGRCDFSTPPAKNFTVANMVEKFPFRWPCKYQGQIDCAFEGTRAALEKHEADCLSIKCPHHECREKVNLGKVAEHFEAVHRRTMEEAVWGPNGGNLWFRLNPRLRTGSPWPVTPFKLEILDFALICSQWHRGELFVWVWALVDEEEATRLWCSLRVGDGNKTVTVYTPPVYPLTWDRQRVLRDERCARVSPWCFDSMIINTERATEQQRIEGLTAELGVVLTLKRKEPNNVITRILVNNGYLEAVRNS